MAKGQGSKIVSLMLVMLALSSCAMFGKTTGYSRDKFHGFYKVGEPYQVEGEWFYPREQPNYDEYGVASWYGTDFDGKKTANGDTFDQNALTAAHKTLPLPSMVQVTNLDNNKSLIVMVNDRGPFSRGRILDVSKRTAEVLGFKEKGVAKVRVQYLDGYTRRLLAELPEQKTGKSNLAVTGDLSNPADLEPKPSDKSSAPMETSAAMAEGVASAAVASPQAVASAAKPAASSAKKPKISIDSKTAAAEKAKPAATAKTKTVAPVKEQASATPAAAPAGEDAVASADTALPEAAATEQASTTDIVEPNPAITKITTHFIQAGTFGIKSNAERVEKSLEGLGKVTINPITVAGQTMYRVRLGPIEDTSIAKLALKQVIDRGHADAMLVSDWVAAGTQVQ